MSRLLHSCTEMYLVRSEISIFFLLLLMREVLLLENGLARTPPMGWMSWGYYMCGDDCIKDPNKCLDENLIMRVADAFYIEDYQEAGYEYIIIDDCWSERERNADGQLVPNKQRFPRGMKYLADYIHARHLKFGMYLNIAEDTCMRYPGSRGHFQQDARQLAKWGVDYVKVDGCFVGEDYLDGAYIKMRDALNQTNRPIVFGCSWPYYKKYLHKHDPDYSQIVPVCNLWRNYHDIFPQWGNVKWIIDFYERNASMLQPFHGPGHWCDPDMLILGTKSLLPSQSRIQMAVWSMLSAPLIMSCDMAKISPYEKSLLQNLDLIAIDQDSMGIMALPHKLAKDVTLWVKPHLPAKGDTYYSYSFALVNMRQFEPYVIDIEFKNYGLNNTGEYSVLNVFTGETLRNVTKDDSIRVYIPPMDVVLYSLYPL